MPFDIRITPRDFTPSNEEERRLWASLGKIKRAAFETLRDRMYKEDPLDAELPWSSEPPGFTFPMTYVNIPCPISDFKSLTPPAELKGTEAMLWIAARLKDQHGEIDDVIFTLQAVTRLAAVARYKGETRHVMPPTMLETYRALPEAEREAYVERWFAWVRHGDAFRTVDDEDTGGEPRAEKLFMVPERPSVTVEHEGKTFRASIVFDVSPLLINIDARAAGYIARVCLPWEGTLGSPDTWPEAEQEALWAAILASFDVETSAATSPAFPKIAEQVLRLFQERQKEGSAPPPLDEKAVRIRAWLKVITEAKALEAVVPSSRDSRRVYPAAFRDVIMDRQAATYIRESRKLGLPRDYSRALRWDAIREKEIASWLSEEAAAWDPYKKGKDGGPPFLKRNHSHGVSTAEKSILTEAGEDYIKAQYEGKTFIRSDANGNESFCTYRVAPDGDIYERHISVMDMITARQSAALLTAGWREAQKREIETEAGKLNQLSFWDLDAKVRSTLERRSRNILRAERLQLFMELIVGQVLTRGENPVVVPAEVLCDVVYGAKPRPVNWKQEIDDTLEALRVMRITVRRKNSLMDASKTFGFLSHYGSYVPRGRGAHGDGYYILPVHDMFIGCLRVFEDGVRNNKLSSPTLLNFNKRLSAEEKKGLDYIRTHSGTPVFSRVAGYSSYQHELVHFIERNITLRRDAVHGGTRGTRSGQQVRPDHAEALTPRIYTNAFCPFLEPGREYVAALGHFSRSRGPERGWSLLGTERERSPGGVINQTGRHVPSGRARERVDAINAFLDDLQRVVVDDFGGVVMGRFNRQERSDGGETPQWVRFEDFRKLDMDSLGYKLKVFIFLPADWRDRFMAVFEDRKNVRVTASVQEADDAASYAAADYGGNVVEPLPPSDVWCRENGWAGRPLPERLQAAMRDRGLKRVDLAQIFGVTPGAVTRWLDGSRPIPEDMATLMVRWVTKGQAPSEAELTGLASRQRSPARR